MTDGGGGGRQGRWPFWQVAAVLAVAALALRCLLFGDPVVHIDEQFYLLVGDRLLHGAVPYVDIWDRKPIGLFLVYAAIRLLGGHGILQYQVVATIFAWATAVLVALMGEKLSSRRGGAAAGLLYLMLLDLAQGYGGQAPVFYNLPVAAAALVTALVALGQGPVRARDRWLGCAAMLLVGVAMQIKYTAVFEGMAFGLVLLWGVWRRGRKLSQLALDAVLWIGCAVLPTVAVAGVYAAMGDWPAFAYANFVSIAQRGSAAPGMVLIRLLKMMLVVAPLIYAAAARSLVALPAADRTVVLARRLASIWFAAAVASVLLFGSYFTHYALPLMAPACVAVAPVFAGRKAGRKFGIALLIVGLIAGETVVAMRWFGHGDERAVAPIVEAMRGGRNCPYVYDGFPIVYYELDACFPTVRPFPAHQQQTVETWATGVYQPAAVAAIMARHPDRVLSIEGPYAEENLTSRRALYAVLDRDYHAVGAWQLSRKRRAVVFALNPGVEPLPNRAGRG